MEEDDDASEKEELDYGATADAFASASDDSSVEENKNKKGAKGKKDEDEDDSSGEEEEDDKDDNSEAEEKEQEQEASSSDEEENAEEEEDSDEDEEVAEPDLSYSELPAEAGDEACSFDLRNLTAVNPHPLQETALYKKNKNVNENITINTLQSSSQINDDYILEKATEGCTQLIHALWQLPHEKSDAGPQMILPSYDKIDIPRALPPPPPKVDTRWEKFAKERGISVNKEKRSRKVWDEATQSWKFRHGYDKANAETADDTKGRPGGMWPIMEVGANDDPYADPWEKARDEKHARTEQNRLSRLSNQERAGVVPKGMTRRVGKAREQTRQAGRAGGRLDVPLPTGVPVDLSGKTLRGKTSITAALKATQVSTASLGKFDKMREGEPERKMMLKASKKRKTFLDDSTASKTTGREQERASKVLQTVLNGGGVEKEKARKKGKLAKGVTAYDYEYDDGTDNVLFKKKKGRGGMGKNRKMTKKRIK